MYGSGDQKYGSAEVKLSDVLLEHVQYEIGMLVAMFAKLEAGGLSDAQLNDALIEAFCVHARNLNSFLDSAGEKGKSFADDAAAKSFVDEDYVAFANGAPRSELVAKIQKQIMHISLKRIGAEKVDAVDRRELFLALMAEIQNFSRHLKPNFQSAWKYGALT